MVRSEEKIKDFLSEGKVKPSSEEFWKILKVRI